MIKATDETNIMLIHVAWPIQFGFTPFNLG